MAYQNLNNSINSGLKYQYVSATAEILTASTAFVATDLQLIVLETGFYRLSFSSSVSNSGGTGLDRECRVSAFVNGTQITESEGRAGCVLSGVSLANNGYDATISTEHVLSLNAGQVIQLGYRRVSGGGSVSMFQRSLMLIKVG